MPLEKLMSIRELADYLRISKSNLYRKLQDGEIRSIKVGGRTLFREQDIQEYLNNCEFGEYICNQEEVA
jgi:excisionase family DNA binding protein